MKTLILFGDSLFAQCSKDEVLFLEAQLDNAYDVYNCAVDGWNTDDLLKKSAYISKLEPDTLLISIGTNDGSPWKQIPLETFKANLGPIIQAFSGSRIIFFPPPPVTEDRRPGGKQISNKDLQQYNQAVVDFCQSKGLQYWDSWADLTPLIGTHKDPHNEDGVHFSDPGYKLIFSQLARVVTNES